MNLWKRARPLVVLWLVASAGAFGQSQPRERLELVHADALEGERVGTVTVRRLEGNVFFRQGEAEMRCDRAVQYVEDERVVFRGHVVFTRPSQTLRAEKIEYLAGKREEWAEGGVVARDSLRELRCNWLHYEEIPEFGLAVGDVVLKHHGTRVSLYADTVAYQRAEGWAEGWGSPRIVQEDSLGNPVFTLTGSRVRWEQDSRKFVALGRVQIEQRGSWATCDSLVYFREPNVAILSGHPVTWRRWERMAGVEMEWHFEGDTLREVYVRGRAAVVTEADTVRPGSRRNVVKGDTIRIVFEAGEPKTVHVRGRAISLYYLFEDSEPKGANWVLGDEIVLWVKAGQVQRVRIIGDPEPAEGRYYPERVVQLAPKPAEAADLTLPGQGR